MSTATDLAAALAWLRRRGGATGPELAAYLRDLGLTRKQDEYTARQLRKADGVRYLRPRPDVLGDVGAYVIEPATPTLLQAAQAWARSMASPTCPDCHGAGRAPGVGLNTSERCSCRADCRWCGRVSCRSHGSFEIECGPRRQTAPTWSR
jgi:hypothetical protein